MPVTPVNGPLANTIIGIPPPAPSAVTPTCSNPASPPGTTQALQQPQAPVTTAAGQAKSFAAVKASVPPGAPNLLAGVDERHLSAAMASHLAAVQDRINHENAMHRSLKLEVSNNQKVGAGGKSKKAILDGYAGTKHVARFMRKPYDEKSKVAQIELTTILTNLIGVEAPIAVRNAIKTATDETVVNATVMRFREKMGSMFDIKDYDYTRAKPAVLEYLMLTRWANELVGNLDCYAKQFLVPSDPKKLYDKMTMIDMDSGWERIPAAEFQRQMVEVFGHPKDKVPLSMCGWLDKIFKFEDKVGWAPGTYDSQQNVYGWMLKDYVLGRLDIDIEHLKAKVRFLTSVPQQVVLNSMDELVKAAATEGGVPTPAGEKPRVDGEEFRAKMTKRFFASGEQFCAFLDELEAARQNPSSEIYKHYEQMKPLEF